LLPAAQRVKSRAKITLLEEKCMFNVGNNLLPPPFAGFGTGALPGMGSLPPNGYVSTAGAADGINPSQQQAAAASSLAPWGGGGNGPGGFISQFMSTIFAAFAQMAQYFTSMLGQPPWGGNGGWPPPPAFGPSPGPQPVPQPGGSGGGQGSGGSGGGQGPGGQQFFTSADFKSTGDPHDAFYGTTRDGQTVGGKWSNMANHPNLIVSNSFEGGFRVSTDVGAANAKGVTHNDEATIESDYGRNVVTMKGDGSYSVTEDGKSVALQVGKTQDLASGESVTLNADGSLTVVDKNKSGGEITTTLAAKAGGVSIDASAQNVDLGGYLMRHGEEVASPGGGGGQTPQPNAGVGPPVSGGPILVGPQPQPYQPYQPYAPYGAGEQSPMPDMPSLESLLGA
jgi:hypothetical protein